MIQSGDLNSELPSENKGTSTIAAWNMAISTERGMEPQRAQAVELLKIRVSQLQKSALAGIAITPSDVITLHAKINHPTLWELTEFEKSVKQYDQESLLRATLGILSTDTTIH